jgi:tetratricopeptide (TPR) repeat protein
VNNLTDSQFALFEMLLQRQDYKRAEVIVAKALRASVTTPQRIHWLTARASLRLKSGRVDDAVLDVQKVFSLDPDAPTTPKLLELSADCHLARYEMATVGFTDRADVDKAHELYTRILTGFESYANRGWVRYQLGRAMLIEYRPEDALTCFQQALLEASSVTALTACCYERIGFIHFYELRQLERALHFFNKAIDTYPRSEPAYWLTQVQTMRSRVLRELGRIDEAIDSARIAVTIAETSESRRGLIDALLSLAETLSPLSGRERDTLQCLNQFIQIGRKPLGIDVTWARVHEMIGDAHYRLGHYQSALDAFGTALHYNPYTPWETSLHYRLARSAYQGGEYRRALQSLDRLFRAAHADGDIVSDHHVFLLLGNSQYALNQFSEAAAAYAQALDLMPAHDPDRTIAAEYHQRALDFATEKL